MTLHALLVATAAAALLLVPGARARAGDEAPREARGPRVVSPEALGALWALDARSQGRLPNRDSGKSTPGCASAQFIIDSGGNTMNVVALESQPAGVYDGKLRHFLEHAHFEPAAANPDGDAVHTYMILAWGDDGADAAGVAAKPCTYRVAQ